MAEVFGIAFRLFNTLPRIASSVCGFLVERDENNKQVDSDVAMTLCESAAAPTEQKEPNHGKDPSTEEEKVKGNIVL